MALVLKSVAKVPVTLELALRFRDMEALKGERDLMSHRAKGQVRLIEDREFFPVLWGEMKYGDKFLRGNGNHTSHVIVACMQAHRDGLDEESRRFVYDLLLVKGGKWTGKSP